MTADEVREKIIETLKVVREGDSKKAWQALSDLASLLNYGEPPEDFNSIITDTGYGKWLLNYLEGAVSYGSLEYQDVRKAIAREIAIYMEEWANG